MRFAGIWWASNRMKFWIYATWGLLVSRGEPTDEQLYERWCGSGPLSDRQAAWEELDRRYETP